MTEKLEVALISCTAKKKGENNPEKKFKPKEIYRESSLFIKRWEYAIQNHDIKRIISGQYGVLKPDKPEISYYDLYLGDQSEEYKEIWAKTCFLQLKLQGLIRPDIEFVFHAGEDYFENLAKHIENSVATYRIITEGMKPGKRKTWYTEKVGSLEEIKE